MPRERAGTTPRQAAGPGPSRKADPGPEPLSVEWRQAASDIPAADWQRCFRPPIEGLWLYASLEQAGLDEQFTFAYAVVLRGADIVAIAPVFTAILPISLVAPAIVDRALRLAGPALAHMRFPKTMFVGSPCADEGHVGTAPGTTLAEVVPVLQDAFWRRAGEWGAASLVWKDFPQASWQALRALSRDAGLGEATSYPGTRILGIGRSFDAYLAQLPGNRRHNLRKKLRLSRRHAELDAEVVSRPDPALLADIWRLFQNTYERATTRFERLTERFWEIVTQQAQSRLIVLRQRSDGRPVAFMLVILEGRRAINKFIGIDYDLGAKAYLYFRLWEEFLRFAMQAGAEEAQSGQTGYRAKLDVGHELVPLSNFFRYRSRLMQLIAALVARRISWGSLDEDLREAMESRAWRKSERGANGE